jgi:hypothetical protein
MLRLAAVVALLFAVAGCGAAKTIDTRTASGSRASAARQVASRSPLLAGEVEVVARPGGDVRICEGGNLDLLAYPEPPPTCRGSGPRAVGVRVAALPNRSAKPRERWGTVYLTGVYRDGVFHVISQRWKAPRTHGAPFLPTPPCRTPAGGWRPLASNYEQETAIDAYRHQHRGEITSLAYFDHGGIAVVTSTAPARTRANLATRWPGQVCVVRARYSPIVFHRIDRRMLRLLFDRAHTARYGWFSGAGGSGESDSGQPTAPIEVLLVTPQLRAVLRRQPPGLVAVDAALKPVQRG